MSTPAKVRVRVEWIRRNIAFRARVQQDLESTCKILETMIEAQPENNTYQQRVKRELEVVVQVTKAEIAHVRMDSSQEEAEIGFLLSGQWVVDPTTGFGRPR